jgi:hypothetical protein
VSAILRVGLHWSLYIRAGSRDKLFQKHLPAVAAAIGPLQFGWAALPTKEDEKLFHVATYQTLEAADPVALSLEALRRAYRLHPQWNVFGLECLHTGALSMTVGSFRNDKATQAPCVEDALFEMDEDRIVSGPKIIDGTIVWMTSAAER